MRVEDKAGGERTEGRMVGGSSLRLGDNWNNECCGWIESTELKGAWSCVGSE